MDDNTTVTAVRGLMFQQFARGLLTRRELEQRLAELKLEELGAARS
jgi:hypothetical protein